MTTFVTACVVCVAFAADRPTTEEVAAAVEASRAAYLAAHPVRTQEEEIQHLEYELSSAREKRAAAVRRKNRDEIMSATSEVGRLTRQIKRVRKSYTPPTIIPQLQPLNIRELQRGQVGRIGQANPAASALGRLRSIQILDDNRILVDYEYRSENGGRLVTIGPFLLVGLDTSTVIEGEPLFGSHDVVVTGQYSYESAAGAMRTVQVLEIFDPDQPFK